MILKILILILSIVIWMIDIIVIVIVIPVIPAIRTWADRRSQQPPVQILVVIQWKSMVFTGIQCVFNRTSWICFTLVLKEVSIGEWIVKHRIYIHCFDMHDKHPIIFTWRILPPNSNTVLWECSQVELRNRRARAPRWGHWWCSHVPKNRKVRRCFGTPRIGDLDGFRGWHTSNSVFSRTSKGYKQVKSRHGRRNLTLCTIKINLIFVTLQRKKRDVWTSGMDPTDGSPNMARFWWILRMFEIKTYWCVLRREWGNEWYYIITNNHASNPHSLRKTHQ